MPSESEPSKAQRENNRAGGVRQQDGQGNERQRESVCVSAVRGRRKVPKQDRPSFYPAGLQPVSSKDPKRPSRPEKPKAYLGKQRKLMDQSLLWPC